MKICLIVPGEGGQLRQLDDGEFPLTSINRQGNIGLHFLEHERDTLHP